MATTGQINGNGSPLVSSSTQFYAASEARIALANLVDQGPILAKEVSRTLDNDSQTIAPAAPDARNVALRMRWTRNFGSSARLMNIG